MAVFLIAPDLEKAASRAQAAAPDSPGTPCEKNIASSVATAARIPGPSGEGVSVKATICQNCARKDAARTCAALGGNITAGSDSFESRLNIGWG